MNLADRHAPDLAQLDAVYRDLAARLVRYAEGMLGSRSEAEEAVHDAFAAAAAAAPRDLRPWLFRATRNAAVDQLRRRRRLVSLDAADLELAAHGDPHMSAQLSDQLRMLRLGIEHLTEQQRSALLLRELCGLSYREIAGVVDTSEGGVKLLIFRARRSLQDHAAATRLTCEEAQLRLSAAADGEAGRADSARAALHAAHCVTCSRFRAALRHQRAGLASLVPLAPFGHAAHQPVLHLVHSAGVHSAGSAKAGGGLIGIKSALATTAAAVAVGTGGAAVWHARSAQPVIHRPATPAAASARVAPAGLFASASRRRRLIAAPPVSGESSSVAVEPGDRGGTAATTVATPPSGYDDSADRAAGDPPETEGSTAPPPATGADPAGGGE